MYGDISRHRQVPPALGPCTLERFLFSYTRIAGATPWATLSSPGRHPRDERPSTAVCQQPCPSPHCRDADHSLPTPQQAKRPSSRHKDKHGHIMRQNHAPRASQGRQGRSQDKLQGTETAQIMKTKIIISSIEIISPQSEPRTPGKEPRQAPGHRNSPGHERTRLYLQNVRMSNQAPRAS